jgi:hypothetical protein
MLLDIKNWNRISGRNGRLEGFYIPWDEIEDFEIIINKLIKPPLLKLAVFIL